MFTAIILVCANGIKTPDTCAYQAYQKFVQTREECVYVISEAISFFEYRDEEYDIDWKVVDSRCIDWSEKRV